MRFACLAYRRNASVARSALVLPDDDGVEIPGMVERVVGGAASGEFGYGRNKPECRDDPQGHDTYEGDYVQAKVLCDLVKRFHGEEQLQNDAMNTLLLFTRRGEAAAT